MQYIVRLCKSILKAAIFFTLFAFALNNQDDVTVRFFFGRQWTAPMVLVVLSAFACGIVIGVLGMVPRWWRQRRTGGELEPVGTGRRASDRSSIKRNPATSPTHAPHGL